MAAYTVVAKDMPAYSVVAGNPARVVKMRFSDEVIALLEEIRWWDWPIEEITAFLSVLTAADTNQAVERLRTRARELAEGKKAAD